MGALESGRCQYGTRPDSVRCLLTLEIGHVCPDIRVQGVDDHLAVSRPCNLYAAVDETGRWRCAPPCVVLADVLGLGQEVEQVALVELGLAEHSPLQELLSAVVECAVEKGKEDSSVLAEDVTVRVVQLAEDVDLAEDRVSAGCHGDVCLCMAFVWSLCVGYAIAVDSQDSQDTQGTTSEHCDDVCVRRGLGSRAI